MVRGKIKKLESSSNEFIDYSAENFFLVIEGLDGTGKTEISRRLDWLFSKTSANTLLTFEPHDPSCGGFYIRQVLMKTITRKEFSDLGLALAFAANRLDHYYREISPFLKNRKNSLVICDRYYLSSLVYQSSPVLSIEKVMELNREAPKPNLTIFLNASNKKCFERMQKRAQDKELFEKKLGETRDSYFRAIKYLREFRNENIIEIDADGTIDEVLNSIIEKLNGFLPSWARLPYTLPGSEPLELSIFENGYHKNVNDYVQEILADEDNNWFLTSANYQLLINDLQRKAHNICKKLDAENSVALLFEILAKKGFSVGDRLLYSDVEGYHLKYTMPLNLPQYGILLIGNLHQREDIVIKKISSSDFKNISFIIFFNPIFSNANSFFEQQLVKTYDGDTQAPSIIRQDNILIYNHIFSEVFDQFCQEYKYTLDGIEDLKNQVYSYYSTQLIIP